MLMIQALAETARFNDVEGTFRSAFSDWEVRYLPNSQQYQKNSWDQLSTYYNNIVGAGIWGPCPYILGGYQSGDRYPAAAARIEVRPAWARRLAAERGQVRGRGRGRARRAGGA
jgi:hypothetical protein